MVNVRKIFALLLSLLLFLSVTGCGNKAEQPDSQLVQPTIITGGNKPSTNTSPELNGNSEISVQFPPETVENPDGLPVLKWVCLMEQFITSSNHLWSEDAVKEVNQMLTERMTQELSSVTGQPILSCLTIILKFQLSAASSF